MSEPSGPPDDFVSRYESAAARLLDDVERACADGEDWPRGVRAAIVAVLARLSEEPELGRLLLFEPYDAGRGAQLRHQQTLDRLARLLRAGRRQTGSEELPEHLEEGLVSAMAFFVGRRVAGNRTDVLPTLAPELTSLVLSPYVGREEADRLAEGTDK